MSFGRLGSLGRGIGRLGGSVGVADLTAPVLSAPDVDAVTQTTATAHVTTNEGNGTLYMVITDSTTQPDGAFIRAGQDHIGAAADFADNVAVSSAGVKSFSVTGLTAATQYWFYTTQRDAAQNDSNTTDYGPFETSAALTPGAGTLTWTTNGATGLRPVFTFVLPGDALALDVPKLYTQDSDDVTHTLYLTDDALSAGDITAGSITITGVDPLAEDIWQAHCRLDRPAVGLGDISNESNFTVDLPATPTLAITTPVTDNTPGGTFTTDDLIEGDTAEVQYDTVATFDNDPQTLQRVIDATDDAANSFTFTTPALADGTWHFRPRVVRPLYGPSAYGTSDSITIDATAPTVSAFSPLDNATGVAIDATLIATFAETVTLGTAGVITLKKTSDNTTVDSWDVATDGGSGAGQVEVLTSTALTLHLTSNITNSIEYYVVWDAGVVKDVAGNNVAALSSTTTWSFTTVAAGNNLLTGLVSYWKMDEASGNALDAHGANDLTDNGSVGAGTGKINGGRDLSGTNQFFSHADNADLSVDGTSFSFAFWINMDSVAATRAVISKRDNAGNGEFVIYANSGTGNVAQFFNYTTGFNGVQASNHGALTTGTLFFIACVADDSAKELRISVNAGTQNVAGYSGSVGATAHTFKIGVEGTANDSDVDGIVDEVVFWKKALSTDDITALYNGGSGLNYASFT